MSRRLILLAGSGVCICLFSIFALPPLTLWSSEYFAEAVPYTVVIPNICNKDPNRFSSRQLPLTILEGTGADCKTMVASSLRPEVVEPLARALQLTPPNGEFEVIREQDAVTIKPLANWKTETKYTISLTKKINFVAHSNGRNVNFVVEPFHFDFELPKPRVWIDKVKAAEVDGPIAESYTDYFAVRSNYLLNESLGVKVHGPTEASVMTDRGGLLKIAGLTPNQHWSVELPKEAFKEKAILENNTFDLQTLSSQEFAALKQESLIQNFKAHFFVSNCDFKNAVSDGDISHIDCQPVTSTEDSFRNFQSNWKTQNRHGYSFTINTFDGDIDGTLDELVTVNVDRLGKPKVVKGTSQKFMSIEAILEQMHSWGLTSSNRESANLIFDQSTNLPANFDASIDGEITNLVFTNFKFK